MSNATFDLLNYRNLAIEACLCGGLKGQVHHPRGCRKWFLHVLQVG